MRGLTDVRLNTLLIKIYTRTTSVCKLSHSIRVSNSLDPDQARHYVGPDLPPNCLQKLSVDDSRRLLNMELIILNNVMSNFPTNFD